jgi:choline dehydrogenase-like flavoprotein
MDSFDFVVVGAGTAGCVVAARLSEEPDRRVLLIEAGGDRGPDAMSVPAMWPTLVGSQVDWGLQTVPQAGLDGAVLPYPQGKVLGGSSGINAMAHLRADRSSYDHWANEGATGWGFDDLLPYFQRTETTAGRDPRFRGSAGPLTIERATEIHPAAEAFFEACEQREYPVSDDLNGAQSEGICWYDRNIVAGRRQSAAEAYLRPILSRPNLTVHTGAAVTDLIVSGGRCTGVRYGRGGSDQRTVQAEREIILCAGAIGSPRLLQLAGIGPAQHLRQQGIDIVADLPGVGANLADHPLGVLVYSASQPLPAGANNHFDALAAVRTDPASTTPDTHILFCDVPLPPPGRAAPVHGYSFEFAMLRPHSRGTVRLASSDPTAAPLVDPGFLTDERDVTFMLRAARAARDVGAATALEAWRDTEVIPGPHVTTDRQLHAYLRQSVGTYFHPVGTCRMGADTDAVTDTELRVHGVDDLRVVDASVMPSLPAANTNATVFAIAEKAADLILASA